MQRWWWFIWSTDRDSYANIGANPVTKPNSF